MANLVGHTVHVLDDDKVGSQQSFISWESLKELFDERNALPNKQFKNEVAGFRVRHNGLDIIFSRIGSADPG